MTKPVILVIDDDLPMLTLMRKILGEFGFEPRVASSRAAAIEAARSTTPAVVLLDKNIPGTLVTEMIEALRNDAGLDGVPLIILSGEPLDADDIARLGATGAVMKPFDVMDLVERLRATVAVAR